MQYSEGQKKHIIRPFDIFPETITNIGAVNYDNENATLTFNNTASSISVQITEPPGTIISAVGAVMRIGGINSASLDITIRRMRIGDTSGTWETVETANVEFETVAEVEEQQTDLPSLVTLEEGYIYNINLYLVVQNINDEFYQAFFISEKRIL